MAKKQVKKMVIRMLLSHAKCRAVCFTTGCRTDYDWGTHQQAVDDVAKHKHDFPNHKPEIECEQSL